VTGSGTSSVAARRRPALCSFDRMSFAPLAIAVGDLRDRFYTYCA